MLGDTGKSSKQKRSMGQSDKSWESCFPSVLISQRKVNSNEQIYMIPAKSLHFSHHCWCIQSRSLLEQSPSTGSLDHPTVPNLYVTTLMTVGSLRRALLGLKSLGLIYSKMKIMWSRRKCLHSSNNGPLPVHDGERETQLTLDQNIHYADFNATCFYLLN